VSKAVRIREHLYAEIAILAKTEHRSLISQLEVLLEQALKMEPAATSRNAAEQMTELASGALTKEEMERGAHAVADLHFKPDPK